MKNNARFTIDGKNASPALRALLNGQLTVGDLRALSPLSENAQKIIDDAVVEVGLDRLTVAADIMAEGLVYPLTDPLSVLEVQWETESKQGGAQRTMHPHARGENNASDRTQHRIPIYLTTDDFSVGVRTLRASARVGNPIDVSAVKQATRRVNEAIEDATWNGAGITVSGNGTYGLLNHPDANAFVYGSGLAWDNVSKTGQNILDDVLGMIDVQQANKMFGPVNLYVPTKYGNKLNNDFKANGTISILARLQELTVGGRNLRVRVADFLPANKTALVQMTDDVVDMIDGQAPTVIPWTAPDGFTLYWMVMAIQVPRVKSDYDGNSGVVVGYTS